MAVLDAQGTTISYEDQLDAAQVIGGVVSFSFGDGQATDIDVTTLASTAKEWRQGLQDFGDCTLELQRDPTDVGQAALAASLAAQTVKEMVITLPGGDIATFNAYVKSISSTGGVDATVTGTASLKVTGTITWS